MANCIKKPGKTSDVPNFFLQGRQLQHAAVGKSVEFGNFWVWRIQGKPMKTTFVGLFFYRNVWWKKFSVSFLPSKTWCIFADISCLLSPIFRYPSAGSLPGHRGSHESPTESMRIGNHIDEGRLCVWSQQKVLLSSSSHIFAPVPEIKFYQSC